MAANNTKSPFTQPLLAPTRPTNASSSSSGHDGDQSYIPSSLSATCTTILGAGRALVGVSCILAPIATLGLFRIDVPLSLALLPRILGVREFTIGALTLWTARRQAIAAREASPEGAERETAYLRTVLWANIINDSEDAIICTTGFLAGSLGWDVTLLLGGGAVLLVALGELSLWGL